MTTNEYKDVHFETPYEDIDAEEGDENISPYIPLGGGYEDDAFLGLRNPNAVVIPEREIRIAFSYPLREVFVFTPLKYKIAKKFPQNFKV